MSTDIYIKFANYFLDYNMNIKDLPKNKKLLDTIKKEEKRRILVLLRYKANKSSKNTNYLYKIINLKANSEVNPQSFYNLLNKFTTNQLKEYLHHCK